MTDSVWKSGALYEQQTEIDAEPSTVLGQLIQGWILTYIFLEFNHLALQSSNHSQAFNFP